MAKPRPPIHRTIAVSAAKMPARIQNRVRFIQKAPDALTVLCDPKFYDDPVAMFHCSTSPGERWFYFLIGPHFLFRSTIRCALHLIVSWVNLQQHESMTRKIG